MKKLVIALALLLGLCGSVGFVYAANNNSDLTGSNSKKNTCEIANCVISEAHSHEACQVSGCNETGNHEHDGMVYHGHSADDGHAYHTCGVAGCTQTGKHSHESSNAGHGNNHHGGHH